LFTIVDSSDDKAISRDEFAKSSFVLDRLGLAGLKFEDMDIDGSGEITLDEMMKVVIQNIDKLEIESGDFKFDTEELIEVNLPQSRISGKDLNTLEKFE